VTVPSDRETTAVPDAVTEPDLATGGLRGATISGTAWTAGSRISQQAVQLAITIVLARLLVPREYGLVAMIAVFTGFAALFVDAGFAAALVQRRRLTAEHLSTAFWLNLGAGVAIAALSAAIAPLVARFYGQPELLVLMPVVGLNFVLVALSIVQMALLERRMLFRRVALIENGALVAGGTVAIVCAFAGLGVWALVIFTLISSGTQSLLLWLVSDWHPTRAVSRGAFRDLWGFGGNLLGSYVLNYWTRTGDNLLIGRFVGPVELGLYNRAYNLVLLQLTNVSYVVGRPLYPALSKLQDEPNRVRHAYLRALAIIALVTFPIATGCLVAAEPLVLTLFGPKWSGVVPLMQILAIAAVLQTICTTTGVVFQSQGRTDWMLRWQAFTCATSVAAFAIGVHWGAKGVAIGVTVQSVLLLYPAFAVPGRLIGMRFVDVVRAVWPVLAAAVVSASAAWAAGKALPSSPAGIRLVVEVAAAAITYLACVHFAKLEPYMEIRELARLRRSKRSASALSAQEA
jgi:O-antigen/teichoic acid export membrane protein